MKNLCQCHHSRKWSSWKFLFCRMNGSSSYAILKNNLFLIDLLGGHLSAGCDSWDILFQESDACFLLSHLSDLNLHHASWFSLRYCFFILIFRWKHLNGSWAHCCCLNWKHPFWRSLHLVVLLELSGSHATCSLQLLCHQYESSVDPIGSWEVYLDYHLLNRLQLHWILYFGKRFCALQEISSCTLFSLCSEFWRTLKDAPKIYKGRYTTLCPIVQTSDNDKPLSAGAADPGFMP